MNERKQKAFGRCKRIEEFVDFVRKAKFHHTGYQYYTTVEVVQNILTHGLLWLRVATSPHLNDLREGVRYGDRSILDRTYIGCFSYGVAEQASFWGLYGKSSQEAVRILCDGATIDAWRTEMRKRKRHFVYDVEDREGRNPILAETMDIRDLIYMAMNEQDADVSKKPKGHSVMCQESFGFVRRDMLDKSCSRISGWVKDYEWRCENETRIGVVLHRNLGDQIAIKIPKYVLEKMSFKLSPWLKADKKAATIQRLRSCISTHLNKELKIEDSSLTGALDQL